MICSLRTVLDDVLGLYHYYINHILSSCSKLLAPCPSLHKLVQFPIQATLTPTSLINLPLYHQASQASFRKEELNFAQSSVAWISTTQGIVSEEAIVIVIMIVIMRLWLLWFLLITRPRLRFVNVSRLQYPSTGRTCFHLTVWALKEIAVCFRALFAR